MDAVGEKSDLRGKIESEIRKEEKKLQIGSFISIFVVCIVIGIPLWWKTTEVYRVGLPYNTIDEQSSFNELPILVQFDVIIPGNIPDPDHLEGQLNNHLQSIIDNEDFPEDHHDHPHTSISKEWRMRRASEMEDAVVEGGGVLRDLDKRLSGLNKSSSGTLSFLIITPLHFEEGDDDDDDSTGGGADDDTVGGGAADDAGGGADDDFSVVMGLDRNVYVKLADPMVMAEKINFVLERFYIRRSVLVNAFQTSNQKMQDQSDKESMTSLPPTPSIDVIFTLVHPGRVELGWDIAQGIKEHLDPMLNDLKAYVNFSIRSQMIHLLSIASPNKFSRACQCHPLPWRHLPHVINPIEPYLASHVTDNPILNFVTYIPSEDQTPLILFHQSGEASKTNSFLVPRWGGILIKNLPPDSKSINSNQPGIPDSPALSINSMEVLSVFLAQLKNLIGFEKPSFYKEKGFKTLTSPKKIIPNWEIDSWLFHRTIDNIGTSTSSMTSLKQLLTVINNMVINDDVGKQVYTAVHNTAASLLALSKGGVHEAYVHSLLALQSSEKAFFDHSLLELLYFPEDQKFAIYLPLFFPLGLPIFATLFHTFRYFANLYQEFKNQKQ